MKLDADTPEIHYRGGRVLNDFDAVIPRIRPSMTYYGCALTRQFEALKVFALIILQLSVNQGINYSLCNYF